MYIRLLLHDFLCFFSASNSIFCTFCCSYPDEFESTRIIGEKQFKMAVELFNKATEKLQGKIGYQHAYLDFSNLDVTVPKAGGGSETVKTCPAAMGFGFAAGTTDGPGAFDFKQGDDQVIKQKAFQYILFLYLCESFSNVLSYVKGNVFWRLVRNVLRTPGPEQVQCQKPKPILLDTGEMKEPYDWAVSSSILCFLITDPRFDILLF